MGKGGGSVELRSVSFRYPARPEVQVFHQFSLKVEPGHSLALVGQSGSGKSTVISLVERFYDAEAGQVSMLPAACQLLPVGTSQHGPVSKCIVCFWGIGVHLCRVLTVWQSQVSTVTVTVES